MTAYSSITPPEGKAYGIGKTIEVTVNFDGNAWAIPGPFLQPYILLTNGTVIYPTSRIGQGTPSITFRYTVVEGHASTGVNYFAAWNTFYADEALTELIDTSEATAVFSNVVVDGVRPTVESVSGPASPQCPAGDPMLFTLTFSEPVIVSGFPQLTITLGSATKKRQARYLTGTGTNEIVFAYVPIDSEKTSSSTITVAALSPFNPAGYINDEAGNPSVLTFSPAQFSGISIIPAPSPPAVSLQNDTGRSSSDRVTSDANLSVSGTDSQQVSFQYSADGGASWAGWFVPQEGKNSILVRSVNQYGKASQPKAFVFTFDSESPASPEIGLTNDTGSSDSDNITSDPTVAHDPASIEYGARLEYSTNNGQWSRTINRKLLAQGLNTIRARQVDQAGNVSPNTTLVILLDTVAPPEMSVSLPNDTGSSNQDKITADGTINVSGSAAGCTTQYSFNGGQTWHETFSAAEGKNTVLVRQVDIAGNASKPGRLSFTLDTQAPDKPVVVMRNSSKEFATETYTPGETSFIASGLVSGDKLEFSTGGQWSETFTPQQGQDLTVSIRRVDRAGNVSNQVTQLKYTYIP